MTASDASDGDYSHSDRVENIKAVSDVSILSIYPSNVASHVFVKPIYILPAFTIAHYLVVCHECRLSAKNHENLHVYRLRRFSSVNSTLGLVLS